MSAAAEPSFTGFVDDLASRLSERSSTFDALVSAMPGVLPDEVLASLRRLPGEHAARLAADAANDRADPMIDQCASLPLPHPLDSEFRFDAPTARSLAAELVASTRDGEEILLVGVPSVAVELATMDVDRKVRFLAPDDCVTAAVARAFDDRRLLLGQGVGATAATALVDPPWYPDPMAALIRVCAAGCRSGATVVFAMPPVGTRPGIVPERAALIGIAGAAGLLPTGEVTDVRYRSPLFELAAMERMGIARLPGWRRGEAVRFVADATVPDQRWSAPGSTELTVAGVRLRLLPGEGGGGGALLPIGGHEVFSIGERAGSGPFASDAVDDDEPRLRRRPGRREERSRRPRRESWTVAFGNQSTRKRPSPASLR